MATRRPLYYIHNAAPYSEGWRAASRYRLTTTHILQVLGYYSGDRTADEIALEIVGSVEPLPLNDAMIWQREHVQEARQAHTLFFPEDTRIQPGLIVNGDQPWMSCQLDDLVWSVDGPGLSLYKAPYSKMIYSVPMSVHELQLCYNSAVCEWSRPNVDYVIWTPSASSIKRYTPPTVLVSSTGLTLRGLWDSYLWPRLQHFHSTILQPLLATRNLNLEKIYSCDTSDYVAVRDPDLSLASLSSA